MGPIAAIVELPFPIGAISRDANVGQRLKITGTLAGGQTGLWIVVRQFAGNSDNWTSGAIYLWGACLQQGNDPKKGYARTWAFQTANIAAGIACGAV